MLLGKYTSRPPHRVGSLGAMIFVLVLIRVVANIRMIPRLTDLRMAQRKMRAYQNR